jgi:hypothetical protein
MDLHEPSVTFDITPIHQGEEDDGPLMSTDVFLKGRGISLLINITIHGEVTYALGIDGNERIGGTIHWKR